MDDVEKVIATMVLAAAAGGLAVMFRRLLPCRLGLVVPPRIHESGGAVTGQVVWLGRDYETCPQIRVRLCRQTWVRDQDGGASWRTVWQHMARLAPERGTRAGRAVHHEFVLPLPAMSAGGKSGLRTVGMGQSAVSREEARERWVVEASVEEAEGGLVAVHEILVSDPWGE